MADTDLTATLAAIRENAEGLTATHADEDCRPGHACTGHEAIWMANTLEAVLKLAGEWEADAVDLDRDIASARKSQHASDHRQADTDEELTEILREHAEMLREAIAVALPGEVGDKGPEAAPSRRPEAFKRPNGCICVMFGDTGGFRIADLTCPVHGVGGTEPGDGYWEAGDAER